jgi:hypothetical protein
LIPGQVAIFANLTNVSVGGTTTTTAASIGCASNSKISRVIGIIQITAVSTSGSTATRSTSATWLIC